MSKFKKEYSILPQMEGEDFHHHIRTNESTRPCFLIPLITVTIILILSGAVTLTISLFFPETFSQVVHWSHLPIHPFTTTEKGVESITSTTTISSFRKSTTVAHKRPNIGIEDIAFDAMSADSSENFASSSSTEPFNDYSNEESSYNSSTGESHENNKEVNPHISTGNANNVASHVNASHNSNKQNNSFITTEKFEEVVRIIYNNLESMTGIRKPELVIPLFMLICFLSSLTIVSLCCCVMMRRRDNRRRKMFGKIITDLQTGDSKTVLLNQDMDD